MERTLFLHCGWPRTATTSFQKALRKCTDDLAGAGVPYPRDFHAERKGAKATHAHHGLVDLLNRAEDEEALAGFTAYLASQSQSMLLSTESLSNWVQPARLPALMRFLAAAREIMNVTTLWTLRRMDEFLTSMYVFQLAIGKPQAPPMRYFELRMGTWADGLMSGMAALGRDPGMKAVYTRYRSSGEHCGELLEAMGVPDVVRARILKRLRAGPRDGAIRVTHKAALTLLHRRALSKRLGYEISDRTLLLALRSGELQFNGDSEFEPISGATKRRIHIGALRAASEAGFGRYVQYFRDDEVPDMEASATELGVLTDCDLERIAVAIERQGQRVRASRHP